MQQRQIGCNAASGFGLLALDQISMQHIIAIEQVWISKSNERLWYEVTKPEVTEATPERITKWRRWQVTRNSNETNQRCRAPALARTRGSK